MSYVRSTDPLPRNSYDPVSACEAARAKQVVDLMEQAVQNGKQASAQIAGPNSFREFGPGVVIDVARSQNAMHAAGLPVSVKRANVSREMIAAPKVVPLNVSEEEYSGCEYRTGAVLPTTVYKPPAVVMPAQMPAPVVLPPAQQPMASAPHWKNLCWALRNGAVDASQFNPADLLALQFKCSQMGYTGACVPPPLIALYLDQQRRAGTLPHLSTGDLSTIPQAPDMTGVNCPTSWTMGGLVGYRGRRGLAAAWGDKGSLPCGPTWGLKPASGNGSAGVSWKAWLLLAAAGVGLYAAGRR